MTLVTLEPRHVGWRADGDVVASVRVEREGDTLRVVETTYDDVGRLRELFDALADAVTAERLTGADPVLAECGFEERGGELGRVIEPSPAPDGHTRAVTLARLEAAIRGSWSAETSCDPAGWTPGRPAYQQCDVTARVVRDYLGGEIVVAGVVLEGRRVDRHAWNVLPSGLALDLTREQFGRGERLEEPTVVEEYLGETHADRYELLAARVREKLSA